MKVILKVDEAGDLSFALNAARWLIDQPATQKDAILTFGKERAAFYVRRNKASITSQRIKEGKLV